MIHRQRGTNIQLRQCWLDEKTRGPLLPTNQHLRAHSRCHEPFAIHQPATTYYSSIVLASHIFRIPSSTRPPGKSPRHSSASVLDNTIDYTKSGFLADSALEHSSNFQMISNLAAAVAGLTGTYIFLCALLRFTQNVREPPSVEGAFPFLSPIAGMIRKGSSFHNNLR